MKFKNYTFELLCLNYCYILIKNGAFTDLLWSDPDNVDTWAINRRGAGYLFGDKVVKHFNHINKLSLIVRAH